MKKDSSGMLSISATREQMTETAAGSDLFLPVSRLVRLCRNSEGLTLVEVLVAVAVLSIGLLGIAGMQYMAIGGNTYGREMQIASQLGDEYIEREIRGKPYSSLATGPSGAVQVSDAPLDPDPPSLMAVRYGQGDALGPLKFSRTRWVARDCRNVKVADNPANPCDATLPATCDGTSMKGMAAVTVRVCWADSKGGVHSLSMDSIKWDEDMSSLDEASFK